MLIATRHNLHAPLVEAAVKANRHVFVEKPLCLSREELARIDTASAASGATVQVGFNRRFAPASQELKGLLGKITGPKSVSYRVMAGKLDPQHWYANFRESGGRVLGEACHFFDYFCFLFESKPVRCAGPDHVAGVGPLWPFPDSVGAEVEYSDGSCGQLIYSAEGDPEFPKEVFTLYAAGLVAEVTHFQKLVIFRGRKRKAHTFTSKGHAEQMAALAAFLRGEADHPLPY